MGRRTVMIFPEFENAGRIQAIRKKYDPLAGLVASHITLVFPFESPLTDAELGLHIEKCLAGMPPFALILKGFAKRADAYGNYLFLNVARGAEIITEMHRRLYRGELRRFDLGYAYVPHMTVGKLPALTLLDEAFEDAARCDEEFSTVVQRVSVEMIGDRDESIVVMERALG